MYELCTATNTFRTLNYAKVFTHIKIILEKYDTFIMKLKLLHMSKIHFGFRTVRQYTSCYFNQDWTDVLRYLEFICSLKGKVTQKARIKEAF